MIVHEASTPFGGRIAEIVTDEFTCVVTTAKEGFFKGLSTTVTEVRHEQGHPFAKFQYAKSIPKTGRLHCHDGIVTRTDGAGECGRSLSEAVSDLAFELKSGGAVAEVRRLLPASGSSD